MIRVVVNTVRVRGFLSRMMIHIAAIRDRATVRGFLALRRRVANEHTSRSSGEQIAVAIRGHIFQGDPPDAPGGGAVGTYALVCAATGSEPWDRSPG